MGPKTLKWAAVPAFLLACMGLWTALGGPSVVTATALDSEIAPILARIERLEGNDQQLASAMLDITICMIKPECTPDLNRLESWRSRLDDFGVR